MRDIESKFLSLRDDAHLRKIYSTLTPREHKIAIDFIELHCDLDYDDFQFKVNRMFLDKEKPKNFTMILELVSAANLRAK
jgi:hypothetical protein